MKVTYSAICAMMLIFIAAAPATQPSTIAAGTVGKSILIIGDLGVPVGQEVTIKGHKQVNGPLLDLFIVESIDGKKAPPDLKISVDGIEGWADNTIATLRGAELGTLHFVHFEELNYGPNDKRWKGPHQVLYLSFVASEVIEPAGLKVKREK